MIFASRSPKKQENYWLQTCRVHKLVKLGFCPQLDETEMPMPARECSCSDPIGEFQSEFLRGFKQQRPQVLTLSFFPATVVHSCQHLLSLGKQTGVQFPDGVYTINADGKGPVNTYCDMSRDGGGWTLLVTSHTNTWTAKNLRKRNQNKPTLNGDFSILYKADVIKNSLNVGGEWFEYRIEGNERGKRGPCYRFGNILGNYRFCSKSREVKCLDAYLIW